MSIMQKIIPIALALFLPAIGFCADIAVIANKGVGVKSLDNDQVKNIYFLDSKNIGSAKAVLFSIKEDGDAKNRFFAALGTSAEAIKKIWLKAKLTGSGDPPTSVSEDEIVQKVASTPGGIGFVSADKVTPGVIVLLVIK